MARNRKNQSAAVGLGRVAWAGFLCLVIAGSCLGYVWQKHQIRTLGYQKGRLEIQLLRLREQNDKLKQQLAVQLSPASLAQRVKDLKLGLGPAQPSQLWALPEPAADAVAPPHEQQYAVDRGRNAASP